MQYTLDSVKHAEACLMEKYKGSTITYEPVLKSLPEIEYGNTEPNRYYFGVITVGANAEPIEVWFDKTISISVAPNSEIIQLFSKISVSVEGHKNILGIFRGYEFTIK